MLAVEALVEVVPGGDRELEALPHVAHVELAHELDVVAGEPLALELRGARALEVCEGGLAAPPRRGPRAGA